MISCSAGADYLPKQGIACEMRRMKDLYENRKQRRAQREKMRHLFYFYANFGQSTLITSHIFATYIDGYETTLFDSLFLSECICRTLVTDIRILKQVLFHSDKRVVAQQRESYRARP